MRKHLNGRPIVRGRAEGIAMVSRQPLGFWGGYSPTSGQIIDQRHERCGEFAAGKVFVFPRGKGSSTGSAILLQSIKAGCAPAAIINSNTDPILALGSIVADELYGKTVPIVGLGEEPSSTIEEGDRLTVDENGQVQVDRPGCK